MQAHADGGPLACLFAATYPERTHGVVLMNTAPRIAWAPDYPWGMRREDLERMLADPARHHAELWRALSYETWLRRLARRS